MLVILQFCDFRQFDFSKSNFTLIRPMIFKVMKVKAIFWKETLNILSWKKFNVKNFCLSRLINFLTINSLSRKVLKVQSRSIWTIHNYVLRKDTSEKCFQSKVPVQKSRVPRGTYLCRKIFHSLSVDELNSIFLFLVIVNGRLTIWMQHFSKKEKKKMMHGLWDEKD